jgi:hypothetical protein
LFINRYLVLLVIALAPAVSAGAYEVYEQNGKECYWLDGSLPVPFELNEYGCPDCDGEFAAIRDGASHWTEVEGSYFRFVEGTQTDIVNVSSEGYDGHNVVVFYEPEYADAYGQGGLPFGGNYIAVTVIWFRERAGYNEIFECDLAFNGYAWEWDTSTAGTVGKMDVENIATHELGHWLSLDDLYAADSRDFTMYGYSSAGEIKKRSLEYDDEDGIIYLYPEGNPPERPTAYALLQNYPNPFRTNTTITYTVPKGGEGGIYLDVFDITGRKVRTLDDGYKTVGTYEVLWDGTDDSGRPVANGVYIYRLEWLEETAVRKMVLVR